MLIRPSCYSSEAEAGLNRHRMLGIGRDPKPGVSFGAAFRKTNTTLLFSRLFLAVLLGCDAVLVCRGEGARRIWVQQQHAAAAARTGVGLAERCGCAQAKRCSATRRSGKIPWLGPSTALIDRSNSPFSAGRVESRQIDWGRCIEFEDQNAPEWRQRERESERERR